MIAREKNIKSADQPVHVHRLVCVFVILHVTKSEFLTMSLKYFKMPLFYIYDGWLEFLIKDGLLSFLLFC